MVCCLRVGFEKKPEVAIGSREVDEMRASNERVEMLLMIIIGTGRRYVSVYRR